MNSSNEITFHFIYLIQAPTSSQPYSFSLWVLNNTNSIASVFSVIILSLLVLSITVRSNIYVNTKARQKKLLERKAMNIRYIEGLAEEVEKLKRQKKLSGENKETVESIIEKSKNLRNLIEGLKIEK
jgi:hypothetical protein